ncbi:NUDIX domain-containing protein [Cognatishimia sp. F0-27]|uniref:NUDIX domain-containing protein n=1 Tax=Cognatishimia sp. F0-27 TaxID=2816855 RepID=UPI001D0C1342|nr:NUDIX domain-containing protein [Cognatishimia sp. F0-27]MCC1492280.1 NUDIX domain-containing protein [Cognatishimia sp. F0-27]
MSAPDMFFYGTLRHVPLLELVLGRPRAEIALTEVDLPDHAVHWVAEQPFPMILERPGAVAKGVVLRDPTPEDVARLNFYEGGFCYDLRPLTVHAPDGETLSAEVYFPYDGVWEPGAPFDLANWETLWGEITVETAREVMARFETQSAGDVAAILPFIRARAWGRVMGRQGAPCSLRRDPGPGSVEILEEFTGYQGFFRLRALALRHRRFDGEWTDPMSREIFGAFDASLVLPYDPASDRVLLIEQLRFGPIQRADPMPWVLEPIAGLVDAGEDPAETARREAQEEARLSLYDLRFMTRAYASPGYSSEFFHFYLGLADLEQYEPGIAGLSDEHEDIRSHVLSFDAAMALVDSGEINAAPLAMMLLWLARHREQLRQSA